VCNQFNHIRRNIIAETFRNKHLNEVKSSAHGLYFRAAGQGPAAGAV
jgi:hypothetical protein